MIHSGLLGRSRAMKTIAIVGMSNNPGGVETYILNFVSVLEKKYHFVLINTDPSNAIWM